MDALPNYDEVSDEDFSGPYGQEQLEGFDETWDDAYEAETAALFEERPASPGAGSGLTQSGGSGHQSPGLNLLSEKFWPGL